MTETDICNLALSFLKRRNISHIDQDCEEARACKLHYDHLRRMVLRAYNWGFAKAITELVKLDIPSKSWKYVYAYPDNCVVARFIFSGSSKAESDYFDKFGVFLIDDDSFAIGCDVDMAYLEYTYDVNDARMFSNSFIDAFTHILASDLAVGLCGSQYLQNIHYKLYESVIALKVQKDMDSYCKRENKSV